MLGFAAISARAISASVQLQQQIAQVNVLGGTKRKRAKKREGVGICIMPRITALVHGVSVRQIGSAQARMSPVTAKSEAQSVHQFGKGRAKLPSVIARASIVVAAVGNGHATVQRFNVAAFAQSDIPEDELLILLAAA